MTNRRGLFSERVALGLAIAALACTPEETGSDADAGETDDEAEGDGDGDSFELVSASLDATGQFVSLRFSKGVAPVDGVDPSDFRISYAMLTESCTDDGCVTETTYWDPHFYVDYYIEYQPASTDRFEVDLVMAGDQATDVSLRFGLPLDPMLCEYVESYMAGYEVMFVHYSPGDIPVTSSDDDALAAIGMQWVEEAQPVWTAEGDFPNLAPKIAIPCDL